MSRGRGPSRQQVAREYKHSILQEYSGNVASVDLDFSQATKTILYEERPRSFGSVALNAAQNTVAIGAGAEVHLYDLDTGKLTKLRGHGGPIEDLVFSPTEQVLISHATPSVAGHDSDDLDPEIIIWDIDAELSGKRVGIADHEELEEVATRGVAEVQKELGARGLALTLNNDQAEEVQEVITTLLQRYQTRQCVGPENRLVGRLAAHFGSATFSPDGRKVMYLPGKWPGSNGDVQWDVVVYDLSDKTSITLCGHRDAIMSTMFSPDMGTIATVAWDKSVRIWEASTGEQRHVFKTNHQNWAGVFSPDSRFFLATTGDGLVKIWDVVSGDKKWEWEYGAWCRAVDWSPDGRWFVIGGESYGRLAIFEVIDPDFDASPELRHDRKLSVHDPSVGEEGGQGRRDARSLVVLRVKFLGASAGGVKVASITSVDLAVEVFDIETGKKWRVLPKSDDNCHFSAEMYWLQKTGELLTVSHDGLRTWKLE